MLNKAMGSPPIPLQRSITSQQPEIGLAHESWSKSPLPLQVTGLHAYILPDTEDGGGASLTRVTRRRGCWTVPGWTQSSLVQKLLSSPCTEPPPVGGSCCHSPLGWPNLLCSLERQGLPLSNLTSQTCKSLQLRLVHPRLSLYFLHSFLPPRIILTVLRPSDFTARARFADGCGATSGSGGGRLAVAELPRSRTWKLAGARHSRCAACRASFKDWLPLQPRRISEAILPLVSISFFDSHKRLPPPYSIVDRRASSA